MNKLLGITLPLITLSCPAFGTIYVWDGGGSTNRFSNIANWDPTAPTGGPGVGDTGTIGGTFRVEVGTSTELTTGAEITFNGSSYLERNGTSFANMGGTFNFNNSSYMRFSDLRLQAGATLNWNTSGTFSTLGAGTLPMFKDTDGTSTTNMSNGLWSLDSAGTDAIQVFGVFNMTGGVMNVADRIRIQSTGTFNLGGTAQVYVADELTDGVLNFTSTSAAFYHAGHDFNFAGRLDGNLQIDGIAQTDLSGFNVQNVLVEGNPYTKFTVVPEPAAIAFCSGLVAIGLILARRRRD